MTEANECCSARSVLWILVFTGFAVNYMTRTNLNIALISMVKPKVDQLSVNSECSINQLSNRAEDNVTKIQGNGSLYSTGNSSITITTAAPLRKAQSKVFDWDEKEQGSILGSFFWIHWITQIPGGILAAKYGTKGVFAFSNFGAVLFMYIIPTMAYKGSFYLILTRVFQGLIAGFAWPSMHHLTAQWIPPNERSKFVTSYLGSSVGTAITYPLCGFIIDRWGWELVFYVNGVLGTTWFIAWCFLVYDSPQQHPRISASEKEYITSCLNDNISHEQKKIPWGKLLTSLPVWMNVIAQIGGIWGLFTLMTTGPTYFKFIHGWNIRETGLLAGLPHIIRMLFASLVSELGDYLLRTKKMSRTNVRKVATAICCILQGVFTLCLAYSGCSRQAAIIFFTLAVASHGAVSTGPLASIVDISPNYASIVLGITNTFVTMTGFLTPAVVGFLTYQNQTVHQWQKVYFISTGFMVSSGILYCIFAKSDVQAWNFQDRGAYEGEKELMVLKNKNGNEVDLMIREEEKE